MKNEKQALRMIFTSENLENVLTICYETSLSNVPPSVQPMCLKVIHEHAYEKYKHYSLMRFE